jgi:hypothetical protein
MKSRITHAALWANKNVSHNEKMEEPGLILWDTNTIHATDWLSDIHPSN